MSYSAFPGLLELIQLNGGRIENRISLQKQVYILKWMGGSDFDRLPFVYHHYGPYSRELSDHLHTAVASGCLTEEPEEFENGTRRYS